MQVNRYKLQAQIYTNYNIVITVLPLLLWKAYFNRPNSTKHATFSFKETHSAYEQKQFRVDPS